MITPSTGTDWDDPEYKKWSSMLGNIPSDVTVRHGRYLEMRRMFKTVQAHADWVRRKQEGPKRMSDQRMHANLNLARDYTRRGLTELVRASDTTKAVDNKELGPSGVPSTHDLVRDIQRLNRGDSSHPLSKLNLDQFFGDGIPYDIQGN